MRSHPATELLYAWASCTVADDRDPWVGQHLAACGRCQSYVARATTLSERVQNLPREGVLLRDLWPSIQRSMAGGATASQSKGRSDIVANCPQPADRHRWLRWRRKRATLVAVAAAMLISFGLGRLSGRAELVSSKAATSGVLDGGSPRSASLPDSIASAIAVQKAGTAYLSALASLPRVTNPQSSTAYQGQQAAVAIMQGAALELAKASPYDRHIARLTALLATMRNTDAASGHKPPA